LGCLVLCLNVKPIKTLDVPTITAQEIVDFLGIINAADYIITIDTGTFHAAGGLKKPQVAIFGWADGKIYGTWYERFILVQRHRDNGDWDCGPCYRWHNCVKERSSRPKPCLTNIRADEIIMAAKEMMDRWPIGECSETNI